VRKWKWINVGISQKKCPAPETESASSQQKEILRFITCPPNTLGNSSQVFGHKKWIFCKKKRPWHRTLNPKPLHKDRNCRWNMPLNSTHSFRSDWNCIMGMTNAIRYESQSITEEESWESPPPAAITRPMSKKFTTQKIHKPTGIAKWGGGDFCTMEIVLELSGISTYGNKKTAEDSSSHMCQKIKTIKSLWTSQKRMQMQAGFLSCILCSLLNLAANTIWQATSRQRKQSNSTLCTFLVTEMFTEYKLWLFCKLKVHPVDLHSSKERERERERESKRSNKTDTFPHRAH